MIASLLLNYYLVPPLHTFTIADWQNILALSVFVLIAAAVSRVVDQAARRNVEAARSNAEAETLSTLAGSLLRGEQALPALMQRVKETFAVDSVSLLRRQSEAPASTGAAAPQPVHRTGLTGRGAELDELRRVRRAPDCRSVVTSPAGDAPAISRCAARRRSRRGGLPCRGQRGERGSRCCRP